jgi:cytochrome c553
VKTLFWAALITALALVATTSRLSPAQDMPGADETDVATQMHEHLDRMTTIKSMIISGNLDGVREPAMWLADHEAASGLPENFEPYVGLMRQYAREVNNAPDLKSAAFSVSQIAKTCSNCHLVNEVQIEFGFDQVPAEWSDTVSHMQRHQWAVDRLWDGLIGPSENAWNRGLNMLVDVPLHADDVTDEELADVDTAALDRITGRIHDLAGVGTTATTPAARSEVYGEMLGLCAECHTHLGRGPGQ